MRAILCMQCTCTGRCVPMQIPFLEKGVRLFQQKVLSKESESVLGIDIGTSAIKIVQLRNDEGISVLETYGEIALGPLGDAEVGQSVNLPAETLAKALTDLMKEASVTTTRCGVSVPFVSSLVKLIDVPPLDAKQLATVIPIEARKYIPVSINEVQLDWFIVPETEQRLFEGDTNLEEAKEHPLTRKLALVVAMHNDVLQKYTETLRLAGLEPSFYEIEVFSNMRATVSRSLAPVAIIDVGASSSKLYIIELGIVLASHVISAGSQDITRTLASSTHVSMAKAEEIKRQAGIMSGTQNEDIAHVSHAATLTMERIFSESRRVLAGFQAKYNKVITKVVLTGGGATLKGLSDFARQQLELEVEIAHPFAHVQAPAFLDDVLREAGPDFVVPIGLALRLLQERNG